MRTARPSSSGAADSTADARGAATPARGGGAPGPRLLAALVIGVGVVLRVGRFLDQRSLWGDEARLAVNILGRSYADLALPLDHDQSAPYLFLVATRWLVETLGDSELTLRLAPVVAGCLSLPLFWGVARRVLSPRAALAALGLFAFSEPLIYYSSEAKQYAVDVFVCLLLTTMALPILRREASAWMLLALTVAGGTGVWLSHAAVFVCAGLGLVLIFRAWTEGRRRELLFYCAMAGVWGLSFAVDYLWILRQQPGEVLLRFWADAFAPMPPTSASEVRWYLTTLLGIYRDPVGLEAAGLALALGVVGCAALWRARSWELAMLATPILAALLASMLGLFPFRSAHESQYPFSGRVILFVVPALVLFSAAGLSLLWRSPGRGARWAAWVMLGVLLIGPCVTAAERLWIRPLRLQEMRPLMEEMGRRFVPGDSILLYAQAAPAFDYYRDKTAMKGRLPGALQLLGGPGEDDAVDSDRLLAELAPGARVWVVYAYHERWTSRAESREIRDELDRRGVLLDRLEEPGVSAHLYRVRR